LTQVTSPSGQSTALSYDGAGRVARIIQPSALRTQFTYDTGPASPTKSGRLLTMAHGLNAAGQGGSAVNQRLGTFQYGYESRGNIASITEANKSRIYSYNALERLTKVEQPQPAPQAIASPRISPRST
jgi:YD repeat-containing protein